MSHFSALPQQRVYSDAADASVPPQWLCHADRTAPLQASRSRPALRLSLSSPSSIEEGGGSCAHGRRAAGYVHTHAHGHPGAAAPPPPPAHAAEYAQFSDRCSVSESDADADHAAHWRRAHRSTARHGTSCPAGAMGVLLCVTLAALASVAGITCALVLRSQEVPPARRLLQNSRPVRAIDWDSIALHNPDWAVKDSVTESSARAGDGPVLVRLDDAQFSVGDHTFRLRPLLETLLEQHQSAEAPSAR